MIMRAGLARSWGSSPDCLRSMALVPYSAATALDPWRLGAVESIAISGAWLCALSSLGPAGAWAKAGAGSARGKAIYEASVGSVIAVAEG